MTINEQSRVTNGRKNEPSEALAGTHALVDRLNAGEPYAVAFGGQGGAWLENLEELVSSAGIESELSEVVGEAAATARAGSPRNGRRAAHRLRAHAVGPGAGGRRTAALDQATDHRRDLRPGHPARPDGRNPRADEAGTRPARHSASGDGRALTGHHGLRVAEGQGRQGRRTAGVAAADRRGRLTGVAPSRHGRPGRQVADGVGDQRRPDRIAELLEDFSTDVRTVLPPVLSIRNGGVPSSSPARRSSWAASSSTAARSPRRKRPSARTRSAAVRCSARSSTVCRSRSASTPRGWPTASRSSTGGPQRCGIDARTGTRDDRGDLRAPDRLGGRDRAAARAGGEVDHRPRPERHRHSPDRAGDPGPGRRHRSGGDPRGTAQPVHRRRQSPRSRRRGRATRRRR